MRQEHLETIRKACITAQGEEAFMEKCRHKLMHDENGCPFGKEDHMRPIRLADVLLALDKKSSKEVCVGNDGSFCVGDSPKRAFWNLRKDDLTSQSDECLEFLANLLTTV